MERKVYVVLTDTGTLLTRMIKCYTKKPYNHASLSFDPHFSELYSFGRKRPRNPFTGGFVKESIHTGLLKQAKCAIYCCTITESQFLKMNQYIRQIEIERDLYRYNLLGLFAIPLNKQFNRKHAFFCSQFVFTVLKEAQVVELPKHPSHVTPHDFQQIPFFQLVYQGDFEDYKHVSDIVESKEDSRMNRADLIRLVMKKLRLPTLPL
ncbi:hypothetical protein [Bacillus tuaregi]|uniref:hypothetical protein n=1 Tax=Bacillus tuaregi TaxID=1816695 RepID=UPI0008F922EC|nr:hypothetical protein [Bacillus tuaregi]